MHGSSSGVDMMHEDVDMDNIDVGAQDLRCDPDATLPPAFATLMSVEEANEGGVDKDVPNNEDMVNEEELEVLDEEELDIEEDFRPMRVKEDLCLELKIDNDAMQDLIKDALTSTMSVSGHSQRQRAGGQACTSAKPQRLNKAERSQAVERKVYRRRDRAVVEEQPPRRPPEMTTQDENRVPVLGVEEPPPEVTPSVVQLSATGLAESPSLSHVHGTNDNPLHDEHHSDTLGDARIADYDLESLDDEHIDSAEFGLLVTRMSILRSKL
ncbi:hypothetical protein L7F22_035362 [Adiantum nelumboides]|nr:hypothetical protein [Adiantum nelumboides]